MSFTIKLLCFISAFIFLVSKSSFSYENLSVGFIYRNPPEEAYYLYDWLVVDPDEFSFELLKEKFYIQKRSKIIAYISVGEVEPIRKYFKDIKKDWIIGENKYWKTLIVDLRKEDYQNFLINKVLGTLKDFDGFFLDTLDSYKFVLSKNEYPSYEKALINFIKTLRELYPEKLILINRGFEIFSEVKSLINGVVVESLFFGFDLQKKEYKKLDPEETAWLLEKLKKIKNYGLPVIVIDYVPPYQKTLAKKIAKKIWQEGFIPYVSNIELNIIGTSIYQLIPRKILILYDSKENKEIFTFSHRLYQVHLEYLGFVPVFYDINQGLPSYELSDLYTGIIVELNKVENEEELFNFLKTQIERGIKVFFVNNIPFSEEYLKKFNLKFLGVRNLLENVEVIQNTFPFFETKPFVSALDMIYPEKGTPILLMKAENKVFSPLAITEWGGYALEGSLVSYIGNFKLFVFDPVKVFKLIFKPQFPAPDITTENGRRILTIHIDGDSFSRKLSFNPQFYLGEIIRDQFIKRFSIPHTVSIIEGEISPQGLYPESNKELENIAKSIFSLSNVEPASHSFSHPLFWEKEKEEIKGALYNLPIKNYKMNFKREIVGSIEYINRNLLPPQKKVKIFQWTGDCNPPEEAIKLTYKVGVYNVNGGNTQIDNRKPFLSFIGPMGINKGEYFQIFAPIQNENVYTDLWSKYYGYENVISTFKLTDQPYRYKPISIYYHFFSAQYLFSLKALEKVYKYALSQEVNPKFLSEYAQKVLEFRNIAILEDIRNDELIIRGGGNLRSVRFDEPIKVDLQKSKGVLGFKIINNATYVHLSKEGEYKIILSPITPSFYLVDTNGWIEKFEKNENVYKLWLKAYLPLELSLYIDKKCKVKVEPENYELRSSEQVFQYIYRKEKEVYVEATCHP